MKISNSNVESTANTILVITKNGKHFAELRQFWTIKPGMCGYQICSQIWLPSEKNPGENIYSEEKTNGHGYCKQQHSFISFLTQLFNKYRSYGGDVNYLLGGTKHHKGGNYYEIPLTTLKKMVKR